MIAPHPALERFIDDTSTNLTKDYDLLEDVLEVYGSLDHPDLTLDLEAYVDNLIEEAAPHPTNAVTINREALVTGTARAMLSKMRQQIS
jgi:hypothetical protein